MYALKLNVLTTVILAPLGTRLLVKVVLKMKTEFWNNGEQDVYVKMDIKKIPKVTVRNVQEKVRSLSEQYVNVVMAIKKIPKVIANMTVTILVKLVQVQKIINVNHVVII